MTHESYIPALTSALEQVTAELNTIATYDETTDDWTAVPETDTIGNADENIEADATEEWNTRRALMTQLEVRYRNINRALQKIEVGTFGICEISGEPIEAERLAVHPAARTNLAHADRERELPV